MIKTYCKKIFVFAHPLLPFLTVREDNVHCIHNPAPQGNTDKKANQGVQLLLPINYVLKVSAMLILLIFSLKVQASDFYITTSDLNVRNGVGTNYESLVVLEKGDTVKLLENESDYWVKIQYQDKIGYVAKTYLQPIQIKTIENEVQADEGYPFVLFLLLIAIVISVSIVLKQNGKEYRNKSTATLLSLFFGVLGLQYFYLGESNKGIFSILFCWTFIPLLIGIIDSIRFASMNDIIFNDRYNWGKKHLEKTTTIALNINQNNVSTYQMTPNIQIHRVTDNSIIDISEEKLDLSVSESNSQNEKQFEPPYWGHTYVYSFDEIRNATQAQKKFYYHLKNKVLNDEFVDIQGNTNYAFALYFDFLIEYQGHMDIELLEKQFRLIGQICPKTKSYTFRLLQDELRKRSDSYSIEKLKELEEPSYQFEYGYTDYNPDLYKLGNQYKDKLGLDKQEVDWLNKFYNPSNVFISIEGCCIAVINLYLSTLYKLNKYLTETHSSIELEIKKLEKVVLDGFKRSNISSYDWENYSGDYLFQNIESELFLVIFKKSENAIRIKFGHNRKINESFKYLGNSLEHEFDTTIGKEISNFIIEELNNVSIPNVETEIALNIQNVSRWQIEFDELKKSFKSELKSNFIEGIIHLEETNKKNPNIENIFFEASKFIAAFDNVQSLCYYAKYIYYDLKSKNIDNKELTKTVQKSLFKTHEQIYDFKEIIAELIKTSDIQNALDRITKIYIPKRK